MKEWVLQRKQVSRVIQYSKVNQKKEFADNRNQTTLWNLPYMSRSVIGGVNNIQCFCSCIPPTFQFCGWKTGSITKKIIAERAGKADKAIVDTAHHILPKAKLKQAYDSLPEAEKKDIGEDLTGKKEVLSPKQVMSLDFNLILGPRPEDRSDDPRDSFDPNYSGGSLTPRSSALEEVLDPTTREIDPTKLRAGLKKAHDAHASNPILDRSTWTKTGSTYSRDGKP